MPRFPQSGPILVVVDERRIEELPERLFGVSECPFVDNNLCRD